ncbi:hypothetical protein PL78_17995 [Yersinia entomophaga]|uniref:4Fe-4S ferredoxin-type domain-containing protein n=1 Tax=Yersinia entomophaga TaxID=935293 RepID=A0ABN4PXW9_YERET|nr:MULTISPECIES: hypothetical protein [Yersinia]ANI31699.1 hypothetical protein PL78_17995 [Yersinia entomophaga]OWF85011.1 hypothetical protein B4914_18255 [Yersinia entomophaga]
MGCFTFLSPFAERSRVIYPRRSQLKVVLADSPKDCAKAAMTDIGIIGVVKIWCNAERCIGCGACVTYWIPP